MSIEANSLSRRKYLFGSTTSLAMAMQQERRNRARPNLILFFPDQLRAESIGCYGHPLVRTPNIDRLAGSGVRFSYCQSPYPVCTAARCGLLTGWPPHVHGHRTVYHLLHRDEPNLFRYLKSAGYDVYWFGKNDVLTHDCFPDSVTEWADLATGPEWDVKDRPWAPGHPHYYSFLFTEGKDRRQYPDYARVKAAIDVLSKRDSDRPFCIFLATFFPHPPYAGPKGFHNMYRPEQVPGLRPPDIAGKPELYRAIRRSRRLDKLSERDFRTINAVYLGMISYAD
ncbi:MAG: sulfatase-like hydrolase/transferase, partial [Acidobacteria bacterium]|nr:sulfatase-like hydrolase/transferase [Acidobacteriota bacterium]